MFLFLPYGHDRGPIRFPWATIALIAACLLAHIVVSAHDADRERELAGLRVDEKRLEALAKTTRQRGGAFNEAAPLVAQGLSSAETKLAELRQRRQALEGELLAPRSSASSNG